MQEINLKNFGPIQSAEIKFGDLTFFVGPQASGKSILLQLVKLLADRKNIRRTLERYGFVWGANSDEVLDRYFGEGMAAIWTKKTTVQFDGQLFTKEQLLPKKGESIKNAEETLFYIPAQRVVCLQNGWPRFFTEYEDSVPYVLRHFSETLRQLLERSSGSSEAIFPQNQRLKTPLRDSFNDSVFHDGKVVIDKSGKKRFKLRIGKSAIPFMAWSAGQKEFMPLLLSFYWLCPASKASRKDDVRYVVLEEPEMGLHPQAIQSVILQVIDLLSRGYKVIISTHSPVLLEFAWAFRLLQQVGADDSVLYELFNLKKSASLHQLFKSILTTKTINTYSFGRINDKVVVKDISTLDASSDDSAVAEWGGLSTFSARAADIISKTMAHEG